MSYQSSLLRYDPPAFVNEEGKQAGKEQDENDRRQVLDDVTSGEEKTSKGTKKQKKSRFLRLKSSKKGRAEGKTCSGEENAAGSISGSCESSPARFSRQSTTGDRELDEIIDTVLPPKRNKLRSEAAMSQETDGIEDEESPSASESDSQLGAGDEEEKQQRPRKALGVRCMQRVSKIQASREDLIQLKDYFQLELETREARLIGLCQVREDIYDQLFSELIRQVLINQPERGVLLNNIRNESKMKLDAYEMLVDSSVGFGIAKLVLNEEDLGDTEVEMRGLEDDQNELDAKLKAVEIEMEQLKVQDRELKEVNERRWKQEVDFLKHQQENLSTFLKSISAEEG